MTVQWAHQWWTGGKDVPRNQQFLRESEILVKIKYSQPELNSAEPTTPFSDFYQSQFYLKHVSQKFLRFFGKVFRKYKKRLLYNKMLTSGDLIV